MRANQIAAYRNASYRVGGISFRIGRHSRALDALLRAMRVRQAGMIAAANPGRRMPPGWNRRALARLHARLRRIPWLRAESGDGPWREDQILAAPLPALLVLARIFRQNAAVRLRLARPPSLMSLR